MDPLSITASIVGILAAAGKIGEILNSTISSAIDAPKVFSALRTENEEVRAALSSLYDLLQDLTVSPVHRTSMIQLEQLIATLTGTVLTFSELETLITPFMINDASKITVWMRMQWTRAESSCEKIVERLQRHKVYISLMLNILQW